VAKPVVDGIAQDLEGKARVLRLNVMDEVSAQAARRYGVRALPTFVVFDGQGQVVDIQIGVPDRAAIVTRVNQLGQN
jgi:thioredoxin-like negative regulator of GroEL